MKKLFVLLAMLLVASPVLAAPWDNWEVERKVVLNTSVPELENAIINLVKSYDGVVTPREMDAKRHVYTVDYNDLSHRGYWWGSEKGTPAKYSCAMFSATLKPVGYGDTQMTIRWHRYNGLPVFRHHRKLYEELKLSNKQIVSYKKYRNSAPESRKNRTEYKYRSL